MEPPRPSHSGDNAHPRRPSCTIIACANGSGKSTLYQELQLPGRFVNADLVAKSINRVKPESAALQAGKIVVKDLAWLLAAGQDFVYETTLCSNQSISLIRRAVKAD